MHTGIRLHQTDTYLKQVLFSVANPIHIDSRHVSNRLKPNNRSSSKNTEKEEIDLFPTILHSQKERRRIHSDTS